MPKNKKKDTPSEEVGYGKPPKAHQFKKGTSGNPKGKPKGAKSLASVVNSEAHAPIKVIEGGKTKTVTKREAVIKALVAGALKGEPAALKQLLPLWEVYASDLDAQSGQNAPLTEEELAILEDYARLHELIKKARGGGDAS